LTFGLVQALQVAPHAASLLHTEQTPPPHAWLLAQATSVGSYLQTPPLHVPAGS